jgi:hypothetical protein
MGMSSDNLCCFRSPKYVIVLDQSGRFLISLIELYEEKNSNEQSSSNDSNISMFFLSKGEIKRGDKFATTTTL